MYTHAYMHINMHMHTYIHTHVYERNRELSANANNTDDDRRDECEKENRNIECQIYFTTSSNYILVHRHKALH